MSATIDITKYLCRILYLYYTFTHIINDKVLLFIYMIWIYVWLSFIDKKVSHPNNRYEGTYSIIFMYFYKYLLCFISFTSFVRSYA